ncbi:MULTISPECIES: hypothetical protein [unclassified Saccharopolyspora]|uniref:hypothetical protein n=1 Tax=unclassified Saccharopolyspora TaxID=2646250 RepID=UPI001CD39DB9|nr:MULTISPECIES: hypothetical protein [unclassified Saccharopolyspora]MCA1187581.1 hypothetical protein [Saccharopolyspora sp. 6T]MCA1279735.1 hypothetical protein [Saccharopolyspora sp. 7B]
MTSDDDRDEGITVHLPVELPDLTPQTCRALLAILVELTETKALYGAEGGDQLD